MVKCCQRPGKSMKRRSTARTSFSRIRARTSLGVIGRRLLSAQLRSVRREPRESCLVESAVPSRVLSIALGAWRITRGFHDVLWQPGFMVPASQLLDGPVRFWHDQLFCKPAHHGGVVAWHQDYSYWMRTKPMAHLTCWIGLDDSTRAGGCVHYVPGSHRWPLLPRTGLADDMEAIYSVLTEEQKAAFKPVAIELKQGECSFHHPLMIHGSYANRTDRPRRATVVNLMRDGVVSATDEPLLAGVPPIPTGQKIAGQFFPLLLNDQHD